MPNLKQLNFVVRKKRRAFPAAVAVRYDRRVSRIVISLASGVQSAIAPRDAQGLENARQTELADAEISPSGLGVHFPKLNVDIYIPAVLQGFLDSKCWMASETGKARSNASTDAKTTAARKHGKLGGRPKKVRGESVE